MIILIGFKKKGRSWYLLKKHEIYLGFGMRKDEGLRNFASSLGELKNGLFNILLFRPFLLSTLIMLGFFIRCKRAFLDKLTH